MKRKSKQISIDIPDSERSRGGMSIGEAIFGISILFGFTWFIGNKISSANSQQTAEELNTDENAKLASQIKFQIGKWYNLANTDAILAIAKTIKDWPGVVKAYAALYNGDNIETDLRSAFNSSGGPNGYQTFLNNLAYKGQPQNNNGSGVTKAIQIATLTPNVSKVFLDSSRYAVKLYRNLTDYPVTPYIIYPKGTQMNAEGNVYVQAQNFNYVGSPINVPIYQIKLINGTLVWVNGYTNIKKLKK
jgi:hypothetical protein